MRSFIIAIIILGAIIILTAANSLYVTARIDEMLFVCEKLQSGSQAALTEELVSRWMDCRDIISLTTHKSEIEQVENAVLSLEYYLENPADFNSRLAILINVLEHIRNTQKFSIENIL